MKAQKLILFLYFFLFVFLNQVFATDFTGSRTVVAYVSPNQGNPFYAYGTFGIDIGYKYWAEAGQSEKARTKYFFNLTSIPSNANIISVQLSYFANNYVNSAYKFKLTQIGNYNSPQEIWQNIGDANSIFTDVTYSSGSLSNSALTTMVNSSKGSYLYLGALSQNENSNDSRANLNLTLNIQYEVPVSSVNITADNNFTASGGLNHGTMGIDGVNQTIPLAGYTLSKTVGQNLTLSANSPQNDNQNYQRIWHIGNVNKSDWRREDEFVSNNQTYSFIVSTNDDNKKYVANLRKNYRVDIEQQTEFDGMQNNSAIYIVEQNSGQISAPAQQTINGHTYNFAVWSDGETNNTRTITPADHETYTALYKLPHLSNQTNAFENSSARKFIKTSDGVMHLVYESMRRVWYEKSTNNGGDWILMNDGKPLSFSESKSPTINLRYTTGNISDVGIVYQEKNGDGYDLIFHAFGTNFTNCTCLTRFTIYNSTEDYYEEGEITFSWRTNGEVLAVWKSKETFANPEYILKYWYGAIGPCGITEYQQGHLTTEKDAEYPTTGVYGNSFHITWQETGELFYASYIGDNTSGLTPSIERINISENNGYDYNEHPSLTVLNDNIARIAWVGQRMDETESMQRNVVFMAPDNPSHYWTFGNNVGSANINRPDNVNAYVIGWNEDNGNVNKIVDNYLSQSHIRNLNITGKDIQISNGSTFSNMYATVFNSGTQPYYFLQSDNIQSYYSPSKVSTTSISEGREGIVAKNKLQFYFGVGDVKVDNELVSFKEIADSVRFSNLQTLNQYLTTEPFPLTDNSSFYYSVQFGVTDTSYAQNSLSANSFVKFRVLLLDNNTNQLLGVYDEVTYTLDNLLQHKNIAYQVNTNGIGNRTVRLALEVTENIEPKYALAEKYADDYVITKEKYETIEYKGKLGITEYALLQNYPNPFNPVTTVNYQIPKSGRVVLKVYDILGREVATLVNEEKETGRYTVNFDASALSSGVYLYEIVVNDYRAVKKLMVIK